MAFDTPSQTTGEPNVPDWTEDANSPQVDTGVTSSTYSLSSTFDHVLILVQLENKTSNTVATDLRINGDAGNNYDARFVDGSSASGQDGIPSFIRVPGGAAQTKTWTFPGRFSGRFQAGFSPASTNSFAAVAGVNANVSSPLTSVTLADAIGNNFDIRWQVYGIDNGGLP